MAAARQRSLPVIVMKLTVVMGITWVLGLALAFYPTPYLEYPFVIINSCQGKSVAQSSLSRLSLITARTRSPILPACGRRGGLMVSALDFGSSGHARPMHWVVFFAKTLYSHSAFLSDPGVKMGTGEFTAGGNFAMD